MQTGCVIVMIGHPFRRASREDAKRFVRCLKAELEKRNSMHMGLIEWELGTSQTRCNLCCFLHLWLREYISDLGMRILKDEISLILTNENMRSGPWDDNSTTMKVFICRNNLRPDRDYTGQALRVLREYGISRDRILIDVGPPVRFYKKDYGNEDTSNEMLRRVFDYWQITNTDDAMWRSWGCTISHGEILERLE